MRSLLALVLAAAGVAAQTFSFLGCDAAAGNPDSLYTSSTSVSSFAEVEPACTTKQWTVAWNSNVFCSDAEVSVITDGRTIEYYSCASGNPAIAYKEGDPFPNDGICLCSSASAQGNHGAVYAVVNSGAAGADPIFVGADGFPYRVDGVPGRSFNVLSSPRLSINFGVEAVPASFVFEPTGLTSTLFGSMDLVSCHEISHTGADTIKREAPVRISLNVTSGKVNCYVGIEQVECTSMPAGATVQEFFRECDLESMKCRSLPMAERLQSSLSLSHSHPPLTRVNILLGSWQLSISRDAISKCTNMVICDDFRRWPVAHRACQMLDMHDTVASGAQRRSNQTIEYVRTILCSHYSMQKQMESFFFTHLTVHALDHKLMQSDIHGLLGQRLVEPLPVEGRKAIHHSDILRSAGSVIQAVSDLDSQGADFIEKTHLDYMVPTLQDHSNFPFSRFRKDCGWAKTKGRVEDTMTM